MSKQKGKARALLIIGVLFGVVHLRHESPGLAWRQDVPQEALAGSNPDVHAIVERALARSAATREREIEGVFCRTVTQRTQTFDGDGQVVEDGTRTYAIEPFRGVPFYRLIARNGSPLGEAARDYQEERWREFLDGVEHRSNSADEDEDGAALDGERPHVMVFNADFPVRYGLTLLGLRTVRERPVWVVGFKPKSGRLPVRQRMDHALNKSHGEIWIDRDTWEVAWVSFQTHGTRAVVVGHSWQHFDATGHIDRRPGDGGVWITPSVRPPLPPAWPRAACSSGCSSLHGTRIRRSHSGSSAGSVAPSTMPSRLPDRAWCTRTPGSPG